MCSYFIEVLTGHFQVDGLSRQSNDSISRRPMFGSAPSLSWRRRKRENVENSTKMTSPTTPPVIRRVQRVRTNEKLEKFKFMLVMKNCISKLKFKIVIQNNLVFCLFWNHLNYTIIISSPFHKCLKHNVFLLGQHWARSGHHWSRTIRGRHGNVLPSIRVQRLPLRSLLPEQRLLQHRQHRNRKRLRQLGGFRNWRQLLESGTGRLDPEIFWTADTSKSGTDKPTEDSCSVEKFGIRDSFELRLGRQRRRCSHCECVVRVLWKKRRRLWRIRR